MLLYTLLRVLFHLRAHNLTPSKAMNENGSVEALRPLTTEGYGSVVREMYEDRPDLLKFRSVEARKGSQEGYLEVRLYRNGRSDAVKEVEAALDGTYFMAEYAPLVTSSSQITKAMKWLDSSTNSWNYESSFDGRTSDGIRSVHISLEQGSQIVVADCSDQLLVSSEADNEERNADAVVDNAVTLIKKKVNHVAIKLNPAHSSHSLVEIYQDMASRTLRLCYENPYGRVIGESFTVFVPNNDVRYESSRLLIMDALRLIVQSERSLARFTDSVGKGWESVM